jgi:hypothetical protein
MKHGFNKIADLEPRTGYVIRFEGDDALVTLKALGAKFGVLELLPAQAIKEAGLAAGDEFDLRASLSGGKKTWVFSKLPPAPFDAELDAALRDAETPLSRPPF